MEKYIDLPNYDKFGNETIRQIDGNMQKTASYEKLPYEVQEFISNLVPRKGKGYLLLSALGDEHWGDNRNNDLFPELGLSPKSTMFGYYTFMQAHWFRLHDNKKDSPNWGDVVFTHYNPDMARVELIVEYDKATDEWTEDKLRRHLNIDVSMGTKINYDVCPVCHPQWRKFYQIPEKDMIVLAKRATKSEAIAIGNRHGVDLSYVVARSGGGIQGITPTPDKYCDHIKYHKGKVWDNGQKIYMINLRPKFFDISHVRRHADRIGNVLAKVASVQDTKVAATLKSSQMKKTVPEGKILSTDMSEIEEYYNNFLCPRLRAAEEEIPTETLNRLGRFPLNKIMTSMIAMGMNFKPKEYQRIILVSAGKKHLADRFDREGMHLCDSDIDERLIDAKPIDLSLNDIDSDITGILKNYVDGKSWFRRPIVKRIIMLKHADAEIQSYYNAPKRPSSTLPTMLAAVAAYIAISKVTGAKNFSEIIKGMSRNGMKLLGYTAGALTAKEIFNEQREAHRNHEIYYRNKTAGLGGVATLAGVPLATYVYGEHALNKARRGERLNLVEQGTVRHPMAMSALGVAALNPSIRRSVLSALKKNISKLASTMVKQGMDFNGLNIDNYPIEDQDELIVAMYESIKSS